MSGSQDVPTGVDHLVYGVPDFDAGVSAIHHLLGIKPMPGGRHPDYGTRNALVSLGPETYLEIIGPDPEQPRPLQGRVFGLDVVDEPRLVTWALRAEAIEMVVARANSAGLEMGGVHTGTRETSDGKLRSWRLSDPYAARMNGALPFLIAWGETPHPAGSAPFVGELSGLRLAHPNPDVVRSALAVLGVAMNVEPGPEMRLVATIRTAGDCVELC